MREAPVYLFVGNDVPALMRARDEVVALFLNEETRNENLTEHVSGGRDYGVYMEAVIPEIASEFSTLSMLAESDRVAVIYNPMELFGGAEKKPGGGGKRGKGAAKAKSGEGGGGYLGWIERDLPETQGHIVLIAIEDEADGREVSDRHPLFQLCARMGETRRFSDNKAFFRIEDALLRGDAPACLAAVRDLWKPGKGDMSVYNSLVRSLRYMLQAQVMNLNGRGPRLAESGLFPESPQAALPRAHTVVQGKYKNAPRRYEIADLLACYERLMGVYQALRPAPGDVHVPDALGLTERALAELMARGAGGRPR